MSREAIQAIVVGGSAGALEVLVGILPALPPRCVPIALALHLPPDRPNPLVDLLAPICPLRIKEGEDKEPLQPGILYLAPPNYHLLVERSHTLSLSVDAPVHHSRPSIDVLFESAADAYGPALAGVLLSGANEDGAAGIARIRRKGGLAIVQDPGTASSPMMPGAALNLGPVDHICGPEGIRDLLVRLGDGSCAG